MNLADIVKQMRDEAREGPGERTRTEWQAALVDSALLKIVQAKLLREAARAWLAHVARNVTASMIKPAGIMPRVAAGQLMIWPEMASIAGRDALRAYARKYRNVVGRYALAIRLLGYLDVAYENDDVLAKQGTLLEALIAAGATTEDIANLREVGKVA